MAENSKEKSLDLIPHRLVAMGQDDYPKMPNLTSEHARIFLTEPDVSKFPPEMEPLKKYLADNDIE